MTAPVLQTGTPLVSRILSDHGLNLQAVFDLADLPDDMRASIEAVADVRSYHQLILFGHGGPYLWQAIAAAGGIQGDDPIDCFSMQLVARYFSEEKPANRYCILYPHSHYHLPLQQLGLLAGWHHPSPFRIGINHHWGSWFAYRVAVLADTSLPVSTPMYGPSPCADCHDAPCVTSCPAAVDGAIAQSACVDERLGEDSACATSCPARLACPVRQEMRYEPGQIVYHYGCSLAMIRQYRAQAEVHGSQI